MFWKSLHCEKSFIVLASNQKIPIPRIDNPAVDPSTFFPLPIDLLTFPHVRKLFRSLDGNLLYSQMPKKVFRSLEWDILHSSMHARKVWPLEGGLAWLQGIEFSGMGECKRSHSGDRKTFPAFGNAKVSFPGPEESGRLFRQGRGKKATARTSCSNIHNAMTPATVEPTTAETLASAWVPARAWVKTRAWTPFRAVNRRNTCNSMDASNID
jgi:hypothetical protein